MKKNVLKVPGLATPRWILWIHGWMHGHLLRTGGLNPETNLISSSYITGKSSLFHEACIKRIQALEKDLHKEWTEADELLVDYRRLCIGSKEEAPNLPSATEGAKARINERNAQHRLAKESNRQTVLKRLIEIRGHILSEEQIAVSQMEATAEKLKSIFSAYGHGLILKPVYQNNLPQASYMEFFHEYKSNHTVTMEDLDKVISKAKGDL